MGRRRRIHSFLINLTVVKVSVISAAAFVSQSQRVNFQSLRSSSSHHFQSSTSASSSSSSSSSSPSVDCNDHPHIINNNNNNTCTSSSSYSYDQLSPVPVPGASEYEAWFRSLAPSCFLHPSLRHAHLTSSSSSSLSSSSSSANLGPPLLRSLIWPGTPPPPSSRLLAMRVPPSAVLRVKTYGQDPDWDVDLARQLWHTIQARHPYGQFLTGTLTTTSDRGSTTTRAPSRTDTTSADTTSAEPPPWTAPQALRHWTTAQRQRLASSSPAGARLCQALQQQEQSWQDKYERYLVLNNQPPPAGTNATTSVMSGAQFQWALEAVHSRAYAGVGPSTGGFLSWVSWAAPLVSMVALLTLDGRTASSSELVSTALVLMAVLPAILLQQLGSSGGTAVMLPLIDSVNHDSLATDSRLEYQPWPEAWTLTLGPNSYRPLSSGMDGYEVVMRYGHKTDSELLLNYGFLPELETSGSQPEKEPLNDLNLDDPDDVHRYHLVQAFVARQQSSPPSG